MPTFNIPFHYYIIQKCDGFCRQYLNSTTPNWFIDNDEVFSISLDGLYDAVGAYYIDGKWYRKVFDAVDDEGHPVEKSSYTMVEFTPELVNE